MLGWFNALMPKEEQFFVQFAKHATIVVAGAEALPNAPSKNEVGDVPDERGGGATRNGYAIYDLPRHRLIHHMLPKVPLRTSSLRGLGAWANVFAIESFIDELAEIAGVALVIVALVANSTYAARS